MLQIAVFCLLSGILLASSRPLIRNIRTHEEFKRLIQHHKENTGLPVIIDFFSESCGPCRMIAPHFKKLAKQYKDKAVFAKVDVSLNRGSAAYNNIRSMPTFQFWLDGKVKHKFSGGDVNQLRQFTDKYARDAERNDIKITKENLQLYYQTFASDSPEKASEEHVQNILDKAGGEQGGIGHRKLAEALKKKYGEAPKLVKRSTGASSESDSNSEARGKPKRPEGKGDKEGAESLEKASTDQLLQELKRRAAADPSIQQEYSDVLSEGSQATGRGSSEMTDQEDEEDEDDEGEKSMFTEWIESGYPERVVIIGGGPAGLTAAIYAARAGLNPVIIAPHGGGQLQGKGVLVENFPAVLDATGPEVVFQMMKQAARYGTNFIFSTVAKVDFTSDPLLKHVYFQNPDIVSSELNLQTTSVVDTETVVDEDLMVIKAQSVILATGSDARWLNVSGEEDFKGKGVSACATCDGYLFVDKEVAVIGGGDTAMEEALHLAQTSTKVTIIHRSDSFRASKILQQRVHENEKIDIIYNAIVTAYLGHKELVASHLHDDMDVEEIEHLEHDAGRGEEESELQAREEVVLHKLKVLVNGTSETELFVNGAFVAIGHDPNTWFLQRQVDLLPTGYLKVEPFNTRTSTAGVFACGDVADAHYRQAVTSSGTGAMAALDAERWLIEQGFKDERAEAEAEFMRELMSEIETMEEKKSSVNTYDHTSSSDASDEEDCIEQEETS